MSDLSEFVSLNNATLSTDSKRVAKHFHKLHKNVLRAYDQLDCDPEFNRLNFEPVEELDEKGEARRMIRMTKDGLMLLVMGFTGKEATRIKVAYINAFNEMAEQLQQISMNGFHSLWQQRLELEKQDATTFMWASFGAKRMVERRKAIPLINGRRAKLDAEMQPKLFDHPDRHKTTPLTVVKGKA